MGQSLKIRGSQAQKGFKPHLTACECNQRSGKQAGSGHRQQPVVPGVLPTLLGRLLEVMRAQENRVGLGVWMEPQADSSNQNARLSTQNGAEPMPLQSLWILRNGTALSPESAIFRKQSVHCIIFQPPY